MQALQEVVSAKLQEMITDGSIENLIEQQLKKTVADSIQTALKSYSNFGKAVTEAVQKSIQSDSIDLPMYNEFVAEKIREIFSQTLQEQGVERLEELMKDVVKPVEKESTTQKLLDKLEELWKEEALREQVEVIEIECDRRETAMYVTFHHPCYDWKTVKVTFYNFNHDGKNTWHIGYINEGNQRVTGPVMNAAGQHLEDFTTLLYKYYLMRTEFTLDAEFDSISTYPD